MKGWPSGWKGISWTVCLAFSDAGARIYLFKVFPRPLRTTCKINWSFLRYAASPRQQPSTACGAKQLGFAYATGWLLLALSIQQPSSWNVSIVISCVATVIFQSETNVRSSWNEFIIGKRSSGLLQMMLLGRALPLFKVSGKSHED